MADTVDLRVAFWNAWLLAPRFWSNGPPLPGGDKFFAPDVAERAPEVGHALAGRFDVVAMSEVFEPSEQQGVVGGWPGAELVPGPPRKGLKLTGSGLATLVDQARARVTFVARHAYRSGGDLRDSDTFATKGALLTTIEVDPAFPSVDLVSTHLFAGGDLFPIPGHDDQRRHHAARMRQVDELVRFVEDEHDPGHVLLIVGDFNVQAYDRDPQAADPTGDHRDLVAHLEPLGLTDVWAAHGIGPGPTCTFPTADRLPPDPDKPDAVLDDPEGPVLDPPSERIDYLWLHVPDGVQVDVGRPRRWAFPGRSVRGGPGGSLSDHLALSTTLTLHRPT